LICTILREMIADAYVRPVGAQQRGNGRSSKSESAYTRVLIAFVSMVW